MLGLLSGPHHSASKMGPNATCVVGSRQFLSGALEEDSTTILAVVVNGIVVFNASRA